jgi:sugar phosphate isomerase/epimerase
VTVHDDSARAPAGASGHLSPVLSAAASAGDLAAVRAAAERFGAIELSVDFALDDITPEHVRALRSIGEEHGASFSVHAPFRDVNIASLNDGVFEAAKRDTLRAMDLALGVGAQVLNVHPGIHAYFPADRHPEMKARERDVVEALCRSGQEGGVRVAIENLIDTNSHFEDTWTLDGLLALVRAVDSPVLGFCLDTGHAHQAGQDVSAAIRRLAAEESGLGRARSALFHLHVHDNHGGPIDEHLPLTEGSIGWSDVVRTLNEVGFDGRVVFENRGLERQELARGRWEAMVAG